LRGESVTHTSETIGEEVRERLGEMTPSERRVARTLLATYPTAGLESLPHLAEGAGVTGPTVLRFVRKIGFDGYPDFQRSLREEVQARTESLSSLYRTRGATQDDEVLRRSQQAFMRALDATLTSSSLEDELAHVVDRDDHLEVERLAGAGVDHRHGAGSLVGPAPEEARDLVERPLGGGEPDPLRRHPRPLGEPLE